MKCKAIVFSMMILPGLLWAQHKGHVGKSSADTTKKSIPKEVHVQLGEAHLMIQYHSPAVRGRVIWGGLVPYGEIWVTGAHFATIWEFNKDIVINDKVVPNGKYAIFTVPGRDAWVFILSKKWDQHLADEYDPKDDVVRLSVSPVSLRKIRERLTYEIIKESDSKGRLAISWEKIKIEVPFQVK